MERRRAPRQAYKLDQPDVIRQAAVAPPEDLFRTYSGVCIESVAAGMTDKGTPYRTIEYVNPEGIRERLNIWDKKSFEDLKPGVAVDLAMKKNDKGFWNAKEVKVSETPVFTQEPPKTHPEAPRMTQDEKERAMRSMNALTNATTLISSMIHAGLLKPTSPDDALSDIAKMQEKMIGLHDPKPDVRRTTPTNTK